MFTVGFKMLAQIPGTDTAIHEASKHGWEAVMLVIIIIVLFGGFGILFKVLMNIQSELLKIIQSTTEAITANTATNTALVGSINKLENTVEKSHVTQTVMLARMETSPCLMSGAFSNETNERFKRLREEALKEMSKDINRPK
jgi:hypothetical protein